MDFSKKKRKKIKERKKGKKRKHSCSSDSRTIADLNALIRVYQSISSATRQEQDK